MPQIPGRSRVALAGFGAWGQLHAQALLSLPDVELVAVYCHGDSSAQLAQEKLPGIRCFRDYQGMLGEAGAEAISIAVPNRYHSEFAIMALERGCDVFLEKPIGITLPECDAIVAAELRTQRIVAVNHELRVSEQWGRIRAIVAAGEIGRVRYQSFTLFRHPFRRGSGGWRYDPEIVGSWTLEELVHFFDLVLWYARENPGPLRVQALGNRARSTDHHYDNFTAVLEWPDGSYAALSQCLSGFEHHTSLEIAGEEGSVRTWWSGAMDRTSTPEFELRMQTKTMAKPHSVEMSFSGEVFELRESLRRAFDGFRQRATILSAAEARNAVAICLAAEQAAREGLAVEVSLEPRLPNG